MIRNVVVGQVHAGSDPEALDTALAAIAALTPHGLIDAKVGRDLRLRDESWDFAITSDFIDEQSYRAYDTDEKHNQIRQQLFAPLCAQIVRVQFRAD